MEAEMTEELKQWEYRVVSQGNMWRGPKENELEALLNELGVEGWEVASTFTITNSNKVTVVAKRPLSAEGRRRRSWPG
ncbi:MAG: DUF4177 domain-containing protein [Anaerolinea sp.]|nr:DUF4177 domain-containing protein [Anaerolinea sp.]